MAKFYGDIGFGHAVETVPGVWDDVVTSRKYRGDIIRNTRQLENGASVNNNLTVGNSISIVADAYINNNLVAMRYIKWMGTLWLISNIEVQSPRLILRLGGVYNGPTPSIT